VASFAFLGFFGSVHHTSRTSRASADPASSTKIHSPELTPPIRLQLRPMIDPMRRLVALAALLAAGCAIPPQAPGDCNQLAGCPACPVCPAPPPTAQRVSPFEAVDFGAIPGWKQGEQAAAWPALLASCQALRFREGWRGACAKAAEVRSPTDAEARR